MEFIGIPEGENAEDYLSHYGVKGMKWHKHKAKVDPSRMSNEDMREYGYMVTDFQSLKNLRRNRQDVVDAKNAAKKAAQAKRSKKNADVQTKGRAEIDRRNRVRAALNRAAAKGAAKARARTMNIQNDNANTKNVAAASKGRARRTNATNSYKVNRTNSADSNIVETKASRTRKRRNKQQSRYRASRG